MNHKRLAKAYKWAIIGAGALVWVSCLRDLRTSELDQRFLFLSLITLGCGQSTIRLSPPLVIDKDQCDFAIKTIDEALMAVTA